jgi:hypothetical protein
MLGITATVKYIKLTKELVVDRRPLAKEALFRISLGGKERK